MAAVRSCTKTLASGGGITAPEAAAAMKECMGNVAKPEQVRGPSFRPPSRRETYVLLIWI